MALAAVRRILRPCAGLHGKNLLACRSLATSSAHSTAANQQAREDLAAAYRGLDFYGMGEGICTHLTTRAPSRSGSGDMMLLIPYGLHWSEVTASCLIGVNIATGQVMEGDGDVEPSAANIHTAIYKSKGDTVNCIMHTHQFYTMLLSCLQESELRNVHQHCMRFHGKVAYDRAYGGTAHEGEAESTRLARNLGDKDFLIMGNHGVLGVGHSVAYVFDSMYYLEKAAKLQVMAAATGMKPFEASDEVAQKVARYFDTHGAKFWDKHFLGIKKLLERRQPDYRS
ncbi:putative aldolase class 2 protein PA3430 [Patiria miniata]|uniref:Class II aldolase/adducin N-terminal domain-containing protein n=1 Tax=Patiria miniata TaxID=46514 RepID=A0A914B2B4_PATMI|nr:putative aldolase class 2 protein PA3430 [Patiria miniata]